jgi:hypothetical protein
MKTVTNITYPAFALFAFAFFALLPSAQAVDPPPDGEYPGANTAEGSSALLRLTTGHDNTAVGFQALRSNTTGSSNTATGSAALNGTFNGNLNTADGAFALFNNFDGDQNVAVGANALNGPSHRLSASFNMAIGANALRNNDTGNYNAASGVNALYSNTSGERNTAIGSKSLENNTTGSFNVALGAGAGSGVTTADDVICIGRAVAGANVGGTCFIGNIRGVQTQNANALPVVIDGAGQLGTVASSERFKKDIAIMGQASEGILSLRPVTFHYKKDTTSTPQFGLIAEEVAKVNPDLVSHDEKGELYTVRYEAVNAMLLNEFLKEHRKVQELEANAVRQQKQIEALTAGLQKVSAQLELNKTAPQTVVNNR